jgi:hypothetical protein
MAGRAQGRAAARTESQQAAVAQAAGWTAQRGVAVLQVAQAAGDSPAHQSRSEEAPGSLVHPTLFPAQEQAEYLLGAGLLGRRGIYLLPSDCLRPQICLDDFGILAYLMRRPIGNPSPVIQHRNVVRDIHH